MDQHEEELILIRNYNTFWSLPFMIYSVWKYRLPFTITASKAIYFFITLTCVHLALKIPGVSLLKQIPYLGNPVLLYIVYPMFITNELDRHKIDGKMPYQFMVDMIAFLTEPWRYEHHKPVTGKWKRPINIRIRYRRQGIRDRIEMIYNDTKTPARLMMADGKKL